MATFLSIRDAATRSGYSLRQFRRIYGGKFVELGKYGGFFVVVEEWEAWQRTLPKPQVEVEATQNKADDPEPML